MSVIGWFILSWFSLFCGMLKFMYSGLSCCIVIIVVLVVR